MHKLLRLWIMGMLATAVLAPAASQAQPAAKPPVDPAAPAPAEARPASLSPKEQHKAAEKLVKAGSYDEALVLVEQGLAQDGKDLPLQKLKAEVLSLLGDHAASATAYQLYLDSGATGSNRRKAEKALATLQAILATGVEVTVDHGQAAIYLKSKTRGVLCTAAPSCSKAYVAGVHNVIAEAPGYEPWSGKVTIVKGQIAKLSIQLVEKPSQLTINVTPPDATITVDDAPYAGPVELLPGAHKVTVTRAGHVTERRDVTAKEGLALALDIALTALVPVRVSPATATLALDGKPVTVKDGMLAIPAGAHALVVSAPEHRERKLDIPASRDAGYKLEVTLQSNRAAARGPAPSMFTRRRKIAVAAAGVSVAAVAAGAVLGLSSRSLEDDSYELCPQPESCADADEANRLHDRSSSRALQANIAFGVSGAAAIAAVVLWVTGRPETPARESRLSITPRLDGSAGVNVGLRF